MYLFQESLIVILHECLSDLRISVLHIFLLLSVDYLIESTAKNSRILSYRHFILMKINVKLPEKVYK